MSSTFKIVIAADDKASQVVRGVQGEVAKFEKRFDSVGRSLFGAANEASRFGREIGLLTRGIPALTVAGIAAGVVTLANSWGFAAQRLSNTSRVLGVGTGSLQRFEAAAKLGGLQAADMDSALQGLGNTLQDAKFGRNPQVATLMNAWGMSLKRTKDGAIDTVAALQDVGDIIQKNLAHGGTVQSASKIADAFGVGSLFPILAEQGRLGHLLERTDALKLTFSPDEIKQAEQYAEQVNALGAAFERVKRAVGGLVIPSLTPVMQGAADMLSGTAPNNAHEGGAVAERERVWNSMKALGPLTNKEAATQFDAAKDPGTAGIMQEMMQKYWWSKGDAAALASMSFRESRNNPAAVGDNGDAVGLFQWHPDRQAEFKRLTGKDLGTASRDDQLWYANYELTKGRYAAVGRKMAAAAGPYEKADVLTRQWEIPAEPNIEAAIRGRSAMAIADPDMVNRINAGNFSYSGAAKYAQQIRDGMVAARDQRNGIWANEYDGAQQTVLLPDFQLGRKTSSESQSGNQTIIVPDFQLGDGDKPSAPRLNPDSDGHDRNVSQMRVAAAQEPQRVMVQVELANAPRGTKMRTDSTDNVQTSTRIGYALPGAGG